LRVFLSSKNWKGKNGQYPGNESKFKQGKVDLPFLEGKNSLTIGLKKPLHSSMIMVG